MDIEKELPNEKKGFNFGKKANTEKDKKLSKFNFGRKSAESDLEMPEISVGEIQDSITQLPQQSFSERAKEQDAHLSDNTNPLYYFTVYFNNPAQLAKFAKLLELSNIIDSEFFVNGMELADALQQAANAPQHPIKTIYDTMNIKGSYVAPPNAFTFPSDLIQDDINPLFPTIPNNLKQNGDTE